MQATIERSTELKETFYYRHFCVCDDDFLCTSVSLHQWLKVEQKRLFTGVYDMMMI